MPSLANTYRLIADVLAKVTPDAYWRLPVRTRAAVDAEASELGLNPADYHASLAHAEAARARAAADHVDVYGTTSLRPCRVSRSTGCAPSSGCSRSRAS